MNNNKNPFSFLEQYDISQVASILQQELPFVSGVALSSMPPLFTAKVMANMPEDFRVEITGAMSKYRKIPHDTLYDLADELEKKMKNFSSQGKFAQQKNSILANLDLGAISRDINKLKFKKDKPGSTITETEHVESRIISAEEFKKMQHDSLPSHTSASEKKNIKESLTNPATAENKKMQQLDPELRKEIALQKALKQRASKHRSTKITTASGSAPLEKKYKAQKVDGIALAAHILREADPQLRTMIMHEVPELYNRLNKRMFDFGDLERSDKITLGKVFSGLDPKVSALALRFASENIKNKALTSVSRRKAQLIIDEIKLSSNDKVRISDIEDAQQLAIDYAIELQNRGEIIIDPTDSGIV